MGLFSKLKKLDPSRKLLKKAVKHDPLGKKLMSKDPIGKKLLGSSKKNSSGPRTTVGGALRSIATKKTGGPAQSQATKAGQRMGQLGQGFNKPGGRGRMIP
jgi:hypothetical protein